MPVDVATAESQATFAGLDALDLAPAPVVGRARRTWSATWPKLAALGIALLAWQAVVWSHWKPAYVLPGPGRVFPVLREQLADGTLLHALRLTMGRALLGFTTALVIGVVIGAAVARS